MQKTTACLPHDLKAAVKRAAQERTVSEAEVIRESIRVGRRRARPRASWWASPRPRTIARRVDDLLEGFGER
ncbi:MAG: CopG family transcriptional regulator [Mycobacterium sp.]|uniref:ribbon-helix-helix domain-containing protein n=1 Tax=Mycobacterium sp. TaxID=1785 RepID=UPI003C70D808